jgi:hypothetical protein
MGVPHCDACDWFPADAAADKSIYDPRVRSHPEVLAPDPSL